MEHFLKNLIAMRIDKDIFGSVEFPDNNLYGIRTYRAAKNFSSGREKINAHLFKVFMQVKLDATETNYEIGITEQNKYKLITDTFDKFISETNGATGRKSVSNYDKIIIDPLQCAAGR